MGKSSYYFTRNLWGIRNYESICPQTHVIFSNHVYFVIELRQSSLIINYEILLLFYRYLFSSLKFPSLYTYESLHMSSSYLRLFFFLFEWFLESQSLNEQGTEIFHIASAPPYLYIVCMEVINITLQRGIHFIVDETTGTSNSTKDHSLC